MKPVTFKDQNIVYAEDQPEYTPLPALRINNPAGDVVTCWRLSFLERVEILFTGRIWLSMKSFHKKLTPIWMSIHRKSVYSMPRDKVSQFRKVFPLK